MQLKTLAITMSIQLRILAFMPNHKKKNVEISTALEERGE